MILQRKVNVNVSVALYCICMGGAVAIPLGLLFQRLWPRELPDQLEVVPILSFVLTVILPAVCLNLQKQEPHLCVAGIILFIAVMFGGLLYPAL